MSDCGFCDLIDGSGEISLVYDDESTIAFMDNRQIQVGHALVVPRTHVESIFELDDETGAALISATVRVARAVRKAFAPEGMNLWQSNGPAGGQEVPHVHMHVMPRWHGDGLLRVYPQRPDYPDRAALDEQAATIRGAMDR